MRAGVSTFSELLSLVNAIGIEIEFCIVDVMTE
jgi:hypothetical protein